MLVVTGGPANLDPNELAGSQSNDRVVDNSKGWYSFPLPEFNLINLDKFANYPGPRTNIIIQATSNGTGSQLDIIAWLVFRDTKTVIGMPVSTPLSTNYVVMFLVG